jgi:hypothetical protein
VTPDEIVSLRTALKYVARGDDRGTRQRLALLLGVTGLCMAAVAASCGLAVASVASAATRTLARTCSQSVYPTGRPGHIGLVYSVKIRTDTCGRWVRAAERCKYPGAFSGWTYKWHVGLKPVRAIGAKSETACGVLAHSATNWGWEFYNHGTHRWVYKQEGHS